MDHADGPHTATRSGLSLGWIALAGALLVAAAYAALLSRSVYFKTHDDLSGLWWAWAQAHEWHAGVLYPRWFAEFQQGYGTAFGDFYPPLSRMLPALIILLGASPFAAMKGVTVLAAAFATAGCVVLFGSRFGKLAGLFGGLVYGLNPWVSQALLTRGDLATVLAFGFVPWAIWLGGLVVDGGGFLPWLGLGVCTAGVIATHSLTAAVAVPAFLVWTFLAKAGLRSRMVGGSAVLWGLAVSAPVWLPALAEKRFVQIWRMFEPPRGFVYTMNWVRPSQLLESLGVPPTGVSHATDLSTNVSPFVAACAVAAVAVALVGFVRRRTWAAGLAAPACLLAVSLWLTTASSSPLCRVVEPLNYFQFPWRWFMLAAFAGAWLSAWTFGELASGRLPWWGMAVVGGVLALVSVLVWRFVVVPGAVSLPASAIAEASANLVVLVWLFAAGVVGAVAPRCRRSVIAALVAAVWVAGLGSASECYGPYPHPLRGQPSTASLARWERQTGVYGATVQDEYLPIWAHGKPSVSRAGAVAPSPSVRQVSILDQRPGYLRVSVSAASTGLLRYGQYYFPGWQATVDGRPTAVAPDSTGVITIRVPRGEHLITLRMGTTPVRRASGLLALMALAACLLLWGGGWLRRRYRRGSRSATRPAGSCTPSAEA